MTVAYRIQRDPEAFSLSPNRGKRRPRERNEQHLAWLRTLPCVITGKHPVEACHIRMADPRFAKRETGMSEKPHDKWTLPLHPDKHREQHAGSEREFWARHCIDPVLLAAALYDVTGDDEQAFAVVSHARQMAATMVTK